MSMMFFADSAGQATSSGHSSTFVLIAVTLLVLGVAAFWKVFKKAGHSGWASIVPIYNIYVMVKIAGRPGWWVLLYLVPLVNVIVHIIVAIDFAKAFGKSDVFGIFGLWLFSFIGFMILGFGDAQYKGAPKRI